MPLQHLEHFLIQCADIAATRDWYVSVLGMREVKADLMASALEG